MKLTRQQLIDENTALRVEIERLRNENAALRPTPKAASPAPQSTKRPVRVMSLNREWAFKAREQIAKRVDHPVACQPVQIVRCGKPATAWMVF